MNFSSIVFRQHDTYCYPLDKDRMIISLRTGKEIDRVCLSWEDPMSSEYGRRKWTWVGTDRDADTVVDCQTYLLWKFVVEPPYKRLAFVFRLFQGDEAYLFMESGFFKPEDPYVINERWQYFCFPWMNASDICETPAWVPQTRWYQIFPERFRNGNPDLPKKNILPWQTGAVQRTDFYGGDIPGITEKLDYIRDLGLNGIYLTPIFESPSNHRYDTTDYRKIEPAFGTEEDFKELIDEAHKRGIRIMIDGVFNHCGGYFAPWLDVKKYGPASKYFNWFMVNKWPFDPNMISTYNNEFYSFSYGAGMPKLNTNNPEVQDYLIGSVKKWAALGVDALRIDVAFEISHTFFRKLHREMKAFNPEFYIVGEIWQDSVKWLRGEQLDAVMNYPLGFAIQRFYQKGLNRHEFESQITECNNMYQLQNNRVNFNLLDSHDTTRLYNTSFDEDTFYQELLLLYSMAGSSCSYYGTEIMMFGENDPDCRRCMPWDEIEAGTYDARIQTFRDIVAYRRDNPIVLADGVAFSKDETLPDRVLQFDRFAQFDRQPYFDENDRVTVCINADTVPVKVPCGSVILSRKCADGLVQPGGYCVTRK